MITPKTMTVFDEMNIIISEQDYPLGRQRALRAYYAVKALVEAAQLVDVMQHPAVHTALRPFLPTETETNQL